MDRDFAAWLRARRRALGLTQARLAQLAGVHQPTIAAVETGRRTATDDVRSRLVAALQARSGDLLARNRDKVVAVVEQHGARNPRVFGSVARGTDSAGSDVDLLVTFPDAAARLSFFELTEALEALLTVDVDLVDDASSGPAVEQARREALAL